MSIERGRSCISYYSVYYFKCSSNILYFITSKTPSYGHERGREKLLVQFIVVLIIDAVRMVSEPVLFLLHELAELTNRLHCNSQHEALMKKLLVMMILIG